MKVKIVSTNSINRNRTVGYERGIEVKFDNECIAEVEEKDAEHLVTIDDSLSIVREKGSGKKSDTKEMTVDKKDDHEEGGKEKEKEEGRLIDHIVTEEDMANNPEFFEQGLKVGDTIQIPVKREISNEELRETLEAKNKKALVEEFGSLGVTLSMAKDEIINKILEAAEKE